MKINIFRKKYTPGQSKIFQIGLSCNEIPAKKYGGIELVISLLINGLVDCGQNVVCASPGKFSIKGSGHIKTLVEPVAGPKDGVHVANTREHLELAYRGILEQYEDGDIIHFHHPEQAIYIGRKLRRKFWPKKVTMVETAHWLNVGLKSNIIYPSLALKDLLRRKGIVIPHSVDTKTFYPMENDKKEPYLFYSGRITSDKGVHLGAEAAEELGLEYRVAGPITDKCYSDTFLNKCTYIGELAPDELREQYQRALGLVYMTQYIEPFGLSIIEAMACGCPIITTGKGGTGETVVENVTGVFCETVADVVSKLEIVQSIKSNDCIKQAQEYSVHKMARKYLEYFSHI